MPAVADRKHRRPLAINHASCSPFLAQEMVVRLFFSPPALCPLEMIAARNFAKLGCLIVLVLSPWGFRGPGTALGAAPADVTGWRTARWGMTEGELIASFSGELRRLPGRWQYGGAYATHGLFDQEFAGQDFKVFFQMNAQSHRLQQVLLEGGRRRASPSGFASVTLALEKEFGPPSGRCSSLRADGAPAAARLWWRFPTTVVHAVFFDDYTGAIAFENPNVDIDPLTPYRETRRNNPRFLPRRILIRFHPSDRIDLRGKPPCY